MGLVVVVTEVVATGVADNEYGVYEDGEDDDHEGCVHVGCVHAGYVRDMVDNKDSRRNNMHHRTKWYHMYNNLHPGHRNHNYMSRIMIFRVQKVDDHEHRVQLVHVLEVLLRKTYYYSQGQWMIFVPY